LARGTVLVGQGSRIEVTQNLPDVRFLNIRFLFLSFAYASAKREYNAVSVIVDEIWQYYRVETSRYYRSKVLAAKHTCKLCSVWVLNERLDSKSMEIKCTWYSKLG
jgi:hypothetical protein